MDKINQAVNNIVDHMYDTNCRQNYFAGLKHVEDIALMRSELGAFALKQLDTLDTSYDRERAVGILSKIKLY